MTPEQLLQQLKHALRESVRQYEDELAARGKPIPERRAQDITQLEMMWTNQNNPFALIEETTRRCKEFRTGLFGKSQLRNLLMPVINDARYRPSQFYQLYYEENESLKSQLRSRPVITAAMISSASSVTDLQATLQQLFQENASLKSENAELRKENEGIRDSNHSLAGQVQNLHVRLSQLELQFGRSETPSPTAAMVHSVQIEVGKGGRFFN